MEAHSGKLAICISFFGSHFIGRKPIIERLLGQAIALDSGRWLKLSYAWILFFTVSGILNLIVAYQFSEDTWVNFKLFGLLGLTIIFGHTRDLDSQIRDGNTDRGSGKNRCLNLSL